MIAMEVRATKPHPQRAALLLAAAVAGGSPSLSAADHPAAAAPDPGALSGLGIEGLARRFDALQLPDPGRGIRIGDVSGLGLLNTVSSDYGLSPWGRSDPFAMADLTAQFASRLEYRPSSLSGVRFAIGVSESDWGAIAATRALDWDAGTSLRSSPFQVSGLPRVEAGLSYTSRLAGTVLRVGLDGIWQEAASFCSGIALAPECAEVDGHNYRLFGQFGWGPAALTAYYFQSRALGANARLDALSLLSDVNGQADEASRDGFYVQGTYAFGNDKTLIGIGYTRSSMSQAFNGAGLVNSGANGVLGRSNMWTVGVYHNVNDWLRFVAEYHHADQFTAGTQAPGTTSAGSGKTGSSFSVGGFIFW
jgi:hypothetical protein